MDKEMMTPGGSKADYRQRFFVSVPYICGILTMMISALIMAGWLIESKQLIESHQYSYPMQFNAALCFFLAGLSICMLGLRRKYALLLTATTVMLIAMLALLEHVIYRSTGLDAAFINPFISGPTSPFSYMGIDTSICFILAGVALWMSAYLAASRSVSRVITIILLAGFVFSLSTLQIIVQFSQIHADTMPGVFSFMPVQNCLMFMLLSVGIIVNACVHADSVYLFFPIPVFFGIFFASIYLAILMNSYADNRLRTVVAAKAAMEGQRLAYRVNNLFQSLDRLQVRLATLHQRNGQSANADMSVYLHDYQGVMPALAIVDMNKEAEWYYGKNQNLEISSDNLKSIIRNNFTTSLINNDLLLVMKNGYSEKPDRQVLLYIDGVSSSGRGERYLVSVIDPEILIRNLKINDEEGRYYLTIKIDGKNIYQDAGSITENLKQWGEDIELQIKRSSWQLVLYPTDVLLRQYYSIIPFVSLVIGFFIALLTALSIHFGLKSKDDSVKLKNYQDYLKAILNGSAHSIIATRVDGTIELFNRAAEKMLGYKAEEVIGKITPELIHDKFEVKRRAEQLTKELGYPVAPGFETFVAKLRENDFDENEWLYVRKNGSKFPVYLSVYGIKNAGELNGYVGIAQDISDRKELEATKNEFISSVSHELRTPLTAIRGSIGLLLGGAMGSLDEKVLNLLNVAYSNCDRLIRLINDILDIEKMDAGKMLYRYEDVNINDLLEEVVEANRVLGVDHSIRIRLIKSRHDVVVVADRDRLIQVFTNLISNAVKFSNPETVVTVKAIFHAGKVMIAVKDHGVGISEADKKRVFDKFTQVDPGSARRKGGTGLGLSISQKIVEQMHGYIDLRSEVGRGTTFFVTFVAYQYGYMPEVMNREVEE